MSRLLVVDDDDDLRLLLTLRLGMAGHEVLTAADGAEGIAKVRDNQPELVIVDWMMPRLSGIELCRAIRAERGANALPVILMSARIGALSATEAETVGADRFLGKPFDLTYVVTLIEELLDAAPAGV